MYTSTRSVHCTLWHFQHLHIKSLVSTASLTLAINDKCSQLSGISSSLAPCPVLYYDPPATEHLAAAEPTTTTAETGRSFYPQLTFGAGPVRMCWQVICDRWVMMICVTDSVSVPDCKWINNDPHGFSCVDSHKQRGCWHHDDDHDAEWHENHGF